MAQNTTIFSTKVERNNKEGNKNPVCARTGSWQGKGLREYKQFFALHPVQWLSKFLLYILYNAMQIFALHPVRLLSKFLLYIQYPV